MRRPACVWVTVLGSLVLFDLWCARNGTEGDSLSEITRTSLRTHTRAGQTAFVFAWAALTSWLVPHICRSIKEA